MASGRISYNKTTAVGAKINTVMVQGAEFRKSIQELDRVLGKYNDDNASLVTDAGVGDSTVAQTVRDLVARAAGEMAAVVLTGQGITAGSQTNTRALIDAMG